MGDQRRPMGQCGSARTLHFYDDDLVVEGEFGR